MFPSGCNPMPSRNWWLVCLKGTLAVASVPLSWRCVTGKGTYRLAVSGLPIHVGAGWPQVIPVTALVIGYECCHLAVHFLVCQEDSLHTSDLRRHKKDHKALHRSPRTTVSRHCPLLRMLHVALLHPGCSLTHGDWSQVGMEESRLLQGQGICMHYLLRTSGHQIPGRALVPSPTSVSDERTPLPHSTPDPRISLLAGSIRPAEQVLGHSTLSSAFLGAPQLNGQQWEGLCLSWHAPTRTPLGFNFFFSRGLTRSPAEVATSESGHCVDS